MDFWPEYLANSWGREFIAGGFGGAAGVISGYPLDTLRIRLQQPSNPTRSAVGLLRRIVASEGASALYRGMGAPLASVTFQNALVFQTYAVLSRAFDSSTNNINPPSYKSVALAGFGTGALQSFLLSPVELVKIRLQLQQTTGGSPNHHGNDHWRSPTSMAKYIFRREGVRGIFRGLNITALRDAPAHGFYFWTYEYTREQLHPGCRKSGQESLNTMLVAGGLAGVASWLCCYPLDVVKTRLQSQVQSPWDNPPPKYRGIIDCFRKSVQEEGFRVLWRGLGTAIVRAFVVNGAIFAAYEVSLRCLFTNNNHGSIQAEKNRLWEKPV
ncbi:mitochondrial arginine transporter BAC2-like [Telopea speciosissima]|uniref:mitochondrial arginine transporter BAC2-like n=1 Tax=Telopea speciosissima TaxID=54955 RepID=UPI001CC42652|nr:mitochondrial arginine transporter BAC2-like [Telopea speciosissima]